MSDPVLVTLASIPERVGSLQHVVDSLAKQADVVDVKLNDYDEIPGFLGRYTNVTATMTGRPDNRGDGEKFAGIDEWEGYILSCDDDLGYPKDYVTKTVAGIEKYGRERMVSYHAGRVTRWTGHPATVNEPAKRVRCLQRLDEDRTDVNLIGTGVTGWHSGRVPVWSDVFRYPNMADVQLACHMRVMGVEAVALAHDKGWLKDICPPPGKGRRIYESNRKRDGSRCDTFELREQEISRFDWEDPPVGRPKVRVSISTCMRPDPLRQLLDDLGREAQWVDLEVHVYEDPSSADYSLTKRMVRRRGWKWTTMPFRLGREGYWQMIDRQFRDAKRSNADWYLFLQDDVKLVRHAIPRAISTWWRLDDPSTLTLWRLEALEGKPNWTAKPPVQRESAWETFHVDSMFLCRRDTVAYFGFQMPRPSRIPETGSGVGRELSRRLDRMGARMYRVDRSLAVALDVPSIMNPAAREANPARSLKAASVTQQWEEVAA